MATSRPTWVGYWGGFTFAGAIAVTAAAALHGASGSAVSFKAKTTVFMAVEGHGRGLSVNEDGRFVTVQVPLQSLSTGMDLRDRHMRETLDTEHHPQAVLRVARASLTFPVDGASHSGSARGELTLHGQTRPASFNYRAQRSGSTYQVDGSLSIDMTEFGIRPPSYAGVTIKPKVDIAAAFSVKD